MISVEPSPTQEHVGIAQPHTPGPWAVWSAIYDHMCAEVRAVRPGDERGIALVWQHSNGFADARLMSAAPDMHAPLAGLIRLIDENPTAEPGEILTAWRVAGDGEAAARAALAKADGSASDRVTGAEDLGTGRRDTNNTSLHSEEKEETR